MSQALEDELSRLEWFTTETVLEKDPERVKECERIISETKVTIADLSGVHDADAFARLEWGIENRVLETDPKRGKEFERFISKSKDVFRKLENDRAS